MWAFSQIMSVIHRRWRYSQRFIGSTDDINSAKKTTIQSSISFFYPCFRRRIHPVIVQSSWWVTRTKTTPHDSCAAITHSSHKTSALSLSIMHILADIDRWQDLEKTYPNLIYGVPLRMKINVCGHIYEIYTGWLAKPLDRGMTSLQTSRNSRCSPGHLVGWSRATREISSQRPDALLSSSSRRV